MLDKTPFFLLPATRGRKQAGLEPFGSAQGRLFERFEQAPVSNLTLNLER
jgi:hypothetical protein